MGKASSAAQLRFTPEEIKPFILKKQEQFLYTQLHSFEPENRS